MQNEYKFIAILAINKKYIGDKIHNKPNKTNGLDIIDVYKADIYIGNIIYRRSKVLKIKVVDSMMGKGKSSWSIQHMNKKQKEGERFIYVTPYLDEVDRVKKQCGFEEPDLSSSSKLDSLKKIIANNKSIATTHALFKMLDNEVLELLSVGYTLILDEVLDVVEETTLPKGDIDNMIKLKMLKYDGDKLVIDDEKVVKEKSEIENEYQNIAFNLLRKNLDIINGNKKIALIWLFPIDILKCFEEVYILTFMFDGYPMKGYLDAHGIKQIKYSVYCSNPEEEYENRIFKLKDYEYPNIKDIQHLIERPIVTGKQIGRAHV